MIDEKVLIEELKKEMYEVHKSNIVRETADMCWVGGILKAIQIVNQQPTVEQVPLSEIYRVIAGHSDYHGDNILAALTCIAEGKEVKPVKPLSQSTIQPQGIDKDRLIEELKEMRVNAFLTLANSGNEALDKAWEYSSTYLDEAIEAVKRSVQPTTDGWIPVSSGELPKEEEDVLIQWG